MAIRQARKTEYKGVVFDSKSEAIFARLLDLHGVPWEGRHPIRHDFHDWDFLVWTYAVRCVVLGDPLQNGQRENATACWHGEHIEPTLIELKPSRPTVTYLNNLVRQHSGQPIRKVVVWGSPFEESEDGIIYRAIPIFPLGEWSLEDDSLLKDEIAGMDEIHLNDALSYRFDLQGVE